MMKSNLEPIEESDLNLEEKLKRGGTAEFMHSSPEKPQYAAEKEVAQEVASAEKDSAYNKILSQVQTANATIDPVQVAQDAHAGYQKMDAQSQVQHLVDLAGQKGIVHAVKVARHMQDNYVLDTFHDRLLADELHDALVAKGMIKEI